MITAVARIALAAQVDADRQHFRDLSDYRQTTVTGQGSTWREAKAACPIPADAVIMSWMRE